MPGKATTEGGISHRVFIQRACGEPWYVLGCVGLTGVQLDPRSPAYFRCRDAEGKLQQQIISRPADPIPFTLTWRGSSVDTRERVMALNQSMKEGCSFNMLLAELDCPDPGSASDPMSGNNWFFLGGIYPTSPLQIGNDTFISLDAAQAVPIDFQRSFAFTTDSVFFKPIFGVLATPDANEGAVTIDSFAFLDTGKCRTDCARCAGAGCQIVLVHDDIGFQASTDGGDTWAVVGAAAPAGHVSAYDNRIFRITPTTIQVSLDGVNFTTALTDSAFAGLTNIVRIDINNYVVLGADGQVWRSSDQGSNWVLIRSANAAFTDFFRACYNPAGANPTLWGIGGNAGATQNVLEYSLDYGITWTPASTSLPYDLDAQIFCKPHTTWIVDDGDFYYTTCDANGDVTSVVQKSIAGADGLITGVGACDPDNCETGWLTTSDKQIFLTFDGGNSWRTQSIAQAVTAAITPDADINPVACCYSTTGGRPIFAFGAKLVEVKPMREFFN